MVAGVDFSESLVEMAEGSPSTAIDAKDAPLGCGWASKATVVFSSAGSSQSSSSLSSLATSTAGLALPAWEAPFLEQPFLGEQQPSREQHELQQR